MAARRPDSFSTICSCCLQVQKKALPSTRGSRLFRRPFHSISPLQQDRSLKQGNDAQTKLPQNDDKEDGAMSRRLAEMTEAATLESGRPSARRNMQQAGFSEGLKKQLEERIAKSSFRSEHVAASSISNMPVSVYTPFIGI
jgi:hypothetical protein